MTFLPNRPVQVLVKDAVSRPMPSLTESATPPAQSRGQGCQWIDGAVSADDGCKCGKPVLSGLPGRAPYCAEHAARCFESPSDWKARNAWIGDLDGGFAAVSLKDWLGGLE